MYEFYNPNPYSRMVGDCVVRALSKALNMTWDECYCELSAYGFSLKDMPSANRVWGNMLSDKGFKRQICDSDMTVKEFVLEHQKGTYLLAIQGHVACCVDGVYFDSWDSGDEVPLYYWEKK